MKFKRVIIIALIAVLGCVGFYLYSKQSIYLVHSGDAFKQYLTFAKSFRDAFYQDGFSFILYMPKAGIGMNGLSFAYYSLLDPFIWLTFLFPSVAMADCFSIIFVLKIILSFLSCYYWLKQIGFQGRSASLAALIYAFSGWLIFFSLYFPALTALYPWLPLAFLGVDLNLKHKRSMMYIFSVFILFLVQFYLFLPAVSALLIYALLRYFQIREFSLKDFLKTGMRIMRDTIIAVFLAGFLIVPLVMILSESSRLASEPVLSILVHNISEIVDIRNFTFMNYDQKMFLSVLSFPAALFIISSAKSKRDRRVYLGFFGISLLLINNRFLALFFSGFLYVKQRYMFLVIPLLIFLIATALDEIQISKRIPKTFYLLFSSYIIFLALLDIPLKLPVLLFNLALLMLFLKLDWLKRFLWILVVTNLLFFTAYNLNNLRNELVRKSLAVSVEQSYVKKALEKLPNSSFYRIVSNYDKSDPNQNPLFGNYAGVSIYHSLIDANYQDFMMNTVNIPRYFSFAVSEDNVVARNALMSYLGVRYVFSTPEQIVPLGYHILDEVIEFGPDGIPTDRNLWILENENAMPLAFGYENYILLNQVKTLPDYQREQLLLEAVVVETAPDSDQLGISYPAPVEISIGPNEFILKNGSFLGQDMFELSENNNLSLDLSPYINGEVEAYLSFELKNDCSVQSVTGVLLNGYAQNNPNFFCGETSLFLNQPNYTFGLGNLDIGSDLSLDLYLDAGTYTISNIKLALFEMESLAENIDHLRNYALKNIVYKANRFSGESNFDKDVILNISIPYSTGWVAKIDGLPVPTFEVNGGMMGMELPAGLHKVTMYYLPPGLLPGLMVSCVGLVGLLWIQFKSKGTR